MKISLDLTKLCHFLSNPRIKSLLQWINAAHVKMAQSKNMFSHMFNIFCSDSAVGFRGFVRRTNLVSIIVSWKALNLTLLIIFITSINTRHSQAFLQIYQWAPNINHKIHSFFASKSYMYFIDSSFWSIRIYVTLIYFVPLFQPFWGYISEHKNISLL